MNNAGVFEDKHIEVKGIEKTMYINFDATRKLTEGLLTLNCTGGKIINIVSKAGLYGELSSKLINNKRNLKVSEPIQLKVGTYFIYKGLG